MPPSAPDELALGCDVRIAGRRARFDTRFMQLGLHPGGGHTWMFRRAAGPQTTMAAVVFGEMLDGEEAARAGLVFRCVDDDELLAAAQAMASRAASAPRGAGDHHEAHDRGDGRRRRPPAAVAAELEPQLWSTRQPWFAERLAALQSRISRRPLLR